MPTEQPEYAHPTDALAHRLHELGYHYGEFSTVGPDGRAWSVDASKGERRILDNSVTLIDAYRQVFEQAANR
jgi:hypothetical protein